MGHLVSILIPAFNAARWIRSSIESALAQTWPRKEIIVVDDGSTDDTLRLAEGFCSREVLVVTQTNRGASAARNQALSLSQGDYVQWLDADDVLAPDKIELQLEGAEAGDSSRILLASAWGQFYYYPSRARFTPSLLWEDLDPAEWLFRKLDNNLWMAIESWLVSRKLTRMAGPWDESLSLDDDGEYFSRVISCSSGIRFVPQARCWCRKGSLGLSHDLTLNSAKLRSLACSIVAHVRMLRSMEDSPRTRAACVKLLQRWGMYFYPERQDIWDEMQAKAAEIGGQLELPRLRKKYRLLAKIFGLNFAKNAQLVLPALRGRFEGGWERVFYR
jgi:GT2 family glycosyltransferase